MTKAQMADWQKHMGVAKGQEWQPFAGIEDQTAFQAWLQQVPFFAKGRRRYTDAAIAITPAQIKF